MAVMVSTTKGLIERPLLNVKDVVFEEETARVIATEWYYDGELVRRDVLVNGLRPLDLTAEQKENNG